MLPGNPKVHSKALSGIRDCSGDPSLQNSLEMAARGLEYVPIWNIQFQKSIFNIHVYSGTYFQVIYINIHGAST